MPNFSSSKLHKYWNIFLVFVSSFYFQVFIWEIFIGMKFFSVAFHIETSHLFSKAKQIAGFYMKRNIHQNWILFSKSLSEEVLVLLGILVRVGHCFRAFLGDFNLFEFPIVSYHSKSCRFFFFFSIDDLDPLISF